MNFSLLALGSLCTFIPRPEARLEAIERLHEVWLPWKVNKKRVAPRATPIHFNGSLPQNYGADVTCRRFMGKKYGISLSRKLCLTEIVPGLNRSTHCTARKMAHNNL